MSTAYDENISYDAEYEARELKNEAFSEWRDHLSPEQEARYCVQFVLGGRRDLAGMTTQAVYIHKAESIVSVTGADLEPCFEEWLYEVWDEEFALAESP